MAESPAHIHGKAAHLPYTTIATFAPGTFLENITVRRDGILLVSSMLAGEIYSIDPNASNPQESIRLVHKFQVADKSSEQAGEASDGGEYGAGKTSWAVIEDPSTPDVFYTYSGVVGKPGTWSIYILDLGATSESHSDVLVKELAPIPGAVWLNGGTILPHTRTLLIADSTLGQVFSYDLATGAVAVWLKHDLLGKLTTRPPWPSVNGVQYHHGYVYLTSSDRALLLRVKVDEARGKPVDGSLEALAEGCAGDDLALDSEGSAYVATNPMQTVLKFPHVAELGRDWEKSSERLIVVGGVEVAETAGPTAVAFGRAEEDRNCLYVVTTGGLVVSPTGVPGEAKVLRVETGVRGEM